MGAPERLEREIANTEDGIEGRVLEAIRQLEMGRDEALGILADRRGELQNAAAETASRIGHASEAAGESLRAVQERLGELNFALAEGRVIGDVETFDRLWTGICDALAAALVELERLEGDKVGAEARSRIRQAWRRFAAALELARRHMEEAAESGAMDFAQERSRLTAELRELQAPPSSQSSRRERIRQLEKTYERFKHIFKALLMHPDESAPFVEKIPAAQRAARDRQKERPR